MYFSLLSPFWRTDSVVFNRLNLHDYYSQKQHFAPFTTQAEIFALKLTLREVGGQHYDSCLRSYFPVSSPMFLKYLFSLTLQKVFWKRNRTQKCTSSTDRSLYFIVKAKIGSGICLVSVPCGSQPTVSVVCNSAVLIWATYIHTVRRLVTLGAGGWAARTSHLYEGRGWREASSSHEPLAARPRSCSCSSGNTTRRTKCGFYFTHGSSCVGTGIAGCRTVDKNYPKQGLKSFLEKASLADLYGGRTVSTTPRTRKHFGRRDAPFGGLSLSSSAAPELQHGRMKQVISMETVWTKQFICYFP